LVALRTRVLESASKQANRSARNAPSEILRRWLRMTRFFGHLYSRFGAG
jgi:hypothetical protein